MERLLTGHYRVVRGRAVRKRSGGSGAKWVNAQSAVNRDDYIRVNTPKDENNCGNQLLRHFCVSVWGLWMYCTFTCV